MSLLPLKGATRKTQDSLFCATKTHHRKTNNGAAGALPIWNSVNECQPGTLGLN